MARTFEYENPIRIGLVRELKRTARKENANIWNAVARALSRSRKNRPEVNIHRINDHTEKNDTVVVPGKVLGTGRLNHRVDVAAFGFTESAKREIENAGGKVFSIQELLKKNAKGSGVKIIG